MSATTKHESSHFDIFSFQTIRRLSYKERGISFEEIVYLIEARKVISIEKHPVRRHQRIYILEIDNCAVVVPFVETESEIFLKMAFPSRKYTRKYGLEEK